MARKSKDQSMSKERDIPIETQQAFVDERLRADEKAQVEEHLKDDAALSEAVAADRANADRLRSELEGTLDEPVPPRLLHAARGAPPRALGWRAGAMAASIAVAVAMGGAGGWMLRGLDAEVEALDHLSSRTALAMRLFGEDVDGAVDIASGDPEEVRAWFETRVATDVSPPTLDEFGYRLAGGRAMMGEARAAGLIAYRGDNGRNLVVFVRGEMNNDDDRDPAVTKHGRHQVVAWTDGPRGIGVAGALPAEDMRRIADAIREQLASAT